MSYIINGIIIGLVGLAGYFVVFLIYEIIKATKDPDVIAASDLRMTVRRYKKYREWYDEHQRLMEQYGIESKEAEKYFVSFFKKIKNPNEWRRYQAYRFKKSRECWYKKYLNDIAYNIYRECPNATFEEWCDNLMGLYPFEKSDAFGVDDGKVKEELRYLYSSLYHTPGCE